MLWVPSLLATPTPTFKNCTISNASGHHSLEPLVTTANRKITKEIRDMGSVEVLVKVIIKLINTMPTETRLNSLEKKKKKTEGLS